MKKTFLLIILQVILAQVVFTQSSVTSKDRVISIPKENGVIAIIQQSDCPLKIESADLLIDEDGKNPEVKYTLKNTSSKAIRYFSVAFHRRFRVGQWHKYGSGSEDGVGDTSGKGVDLLFSGETYTNWRDEEIEIVPMNEKVKSIFSTRSLGQNKENVEPKLKLFYIGLVTKIIFDDGTIYDVKETSNSIYDLLFPD